MATYTAPFQRDAISEVVPRALELSSLSKSSLLTGRRRIRIIPQTGQTYGGPTVTGSGQPSIANILIQDSAGLLDMQSVVLSMNIKVSNLTDGKVNNAKIYDVLPDDGTNYLLDDPATLDVSTNAYLAAASYVESTGSVGQPNVGSLPVPSATAAVESGSLAIAGNPSVGKQKALTIDKADPVQTGVLDDFAWSVFRRIQISLNSQLVDDLDYCGRRATTEVYMSATPDWYQTIGTVIGAWKYVPNSVQQGYLGRPVAPAAGTMPVRGSVGTLQTIASYPIRSAIDTMRFATGLAPAMATVYASPQGGANVQSVQRFASVRATEDLWGQPLTGAAGANFTPWLPYQAAQAGVQGTANNGGLLGTPYGLGVVGREDVLGKVYNASAFFKNVYFSATGTSTSSWTSARPSPSSAASFITAGRWQALDDEGVKFSIPLGLLSHLFRQEQLFPLRNAGQLILQIQFADPVECCFGAASVFADAGGNQHKSTLADFGVPNLTYTCNQVELECDIVTAIPEYTAILDSICSRPADKGLAIAFDSHLSSLQQVTGAGTATPGGILGESTYTLIASKGSENVRSFHFTLSPTAGLRNYEYLQNSTFPSYDMQQWQIRVGSVYYPAFPSRGLSKNYMEMLSSMNSPMPSVGQASIISYNMFRASTPSPKWVQECPVRVVDGVSQRYCWDSGAFTRLASTINTDPAVSAFSDGYIGGYCFDNLKHAEPLSHDGLDTRAIAGGMIQLDFTCRPLEAFAVVFHIRFTRTIVLAENGVSIVG